MSLRGSREGRKSGKGAIKTDRDASQWGRPFAGPPVSSRRENRKSWCSLNAGGVMSCGNSRPSTRRRANTTRGRNHMVPRLSDGEPISIDHERLPPRLSYERRAESSSTSGQNRYNFRRSNFSRLKSRKNISDANCIPIGINKPTS